MKNNQETSVQKSAEKSVETRDVKKQFSMVVKTGIKGGPVEKDEVYCW